MGINTRIGLPTTATIRDVSDVLAFLLGCPVQRATFRNDGTVCAATHSGHVSWRTDDTMPQCCTILIDAPRGPHSFFWHWEWGASEWRGHGMMPRATPTAIALGRRLVRFFGGELDEHDCDDTDVDLRCPPNPLAAAASGQPWQDWQDLKAGVGPLTAEEIADARPNAAYPDNDGIRW